MEEFDCSGWRETRFLSSTLFPFLSWGLQPNTTVDDINPALPIMRALP